MYTIIPVILFVRDTRYSISFHFTLLLSRTHTHTHTVAGRICFGCRSSASFDKLFVYMRLIQFCCIWQAPTLNNNTWQQHSRRHQQLTTTTTTSEFSFLPNNFSSIVHWQQWTAHKRQSLPLQPVLTEF